MEPEDKKNLKSFAVVLIIAGALCVISASFLKPVISALMMISGHIIIVTAMLLLIIYKNEN